MEVPLDEKQAYSEHSGPHMNGRDRNSTIADQLLLWSRFGGIVFAALACVCPVLRAQSSGLLLGFESADMDGYRTVWIYSAAKRANAVSVPDLLVPRNTGFWRIGAYMTSTKSDDPTTLGGVTFPYDEDEKRLWALPANQRHVVTLGKGEVLGDHSGQSCSHLNRDINFVNPSFVAYEQYIGSECGMHPDLELEWKVVSLDRIHGARMSISDLLGPTAEAAFLKALNEATDPNCGTEPKVDTSNWSIVRAKGHWTVRGMAATHRLCDYLIDFAVPVVLPESIIGYDRLPLSWEVLQARIPDLEDALSSPTGDLMLAMTNTELLLYRLEDGKPGALLLHRTRTELGIAKRYWTGDDGRVLMSQWATGHDASAWTAEIQRIAAAEKRPRSK
jgi:hypothetical protein